MDVAAYQWIAKVDDSVCRVGYRSEAISKPKKVTLMRTLIFRLGLFVVLGWSIAAFVGCNSQPAKGPPADEHHQGDGHDHGTSSAAHVDHGHTNHEHEHLTEADLDLPKDFAGAVARIKTCSASVADALKKGDAHDAHKPADELVILAGKLMPLARDGGVPKARWKEINLLAKELESQLGKLHDAVDADKAAGNEAILAAIDATIGELVKVAASLQ
ncbi:MAG: hypothetical protein K2Y37_25600 [Pirellulales bacterium]|nr:hypothetical protein [Pirellulales bacterium]